MRLDPATLCALEVRAGRFRLQSQCRFALRGYHGFEPMREHREELVGLLAVGSEG